MLFKTLKKLVQTMGMTEELEERINTLYALGKLTTAQYNELMGIE